MFAIKENTGAKNYAESKWQESNCESQTKSNTGQQDYHQKYNAFIIQKKSRYIRFLIGNKIGWVPINSKHMKAHRIIR